MSRLAAMVATVLLVAMAVSLVLTVIPGDAARLMVGPEATPERYEAARKALGLDQPWPVRFGRWLFSAMHGDLGQSWRYGDSVSTLILRGLSLTFPLAILVALVSFFLGLGFGLFSVARLGRFSDLIVSGGAAFFLALPEFWLGIVLIGVFAVRLGLFPSGGFPGWEKSQALAYLVLPLLSLALPRAAYFARLSRATLADLLREDFVRTARAKGLRESRVLFWHVLRNGLIPNVAALGLTFGRLLGGALVVEQVFALPGLGRLALEAAFGRDIPLLLGISLVTVTAVVVVSTFSDLLYAVLDPRIRLG